MALQLFPSLRYLAVGNSNVQGRYVEAGRWLQGFSELRGLQVLSCVFLAVEVSVKVKFVVVRVQQKYFLLAVFASSSGE